MYLQSLKSSANMGNPKERKECPICGKTLYDRSTWNRHMRIHTGKLSKHEALFVINIDFFVFSAAGEKPYPCGFCGRRFRTNYNKLGHEKKCPDRHARAILQQNAVTPDSPSVVPNVVYR